VGLAARPKSRCLAKALPIDAMREPPPGMRKRDDAHIVDPYGTFQQRTKEECRKK